MCVPFIQNHQLNRIAKQASRILHAVNTVSDQNVIEAVRYNAIANVIESFSTLDVTQKQLFEPMSQLKTSVDLQMLLQNIFPYVVAFPALTDKQIKKIFPKRKKLKFPDLTTNDFQQISYIGWNDIATHTKFLIYPLNGELVGIECNYTPTYKKSVCFICNGVSETALVSAICKSKPLNTSPDYYRTIGNYMCIDSKECNKNITNISKLEQFIFDVIK